MTKIIIIFLIFLGGFFALGWEMVWQSKISLVYGSSALGTSITLACLSLGMCAGAFVSKFFLRNRLMNVNPIILYGCLEFIIALNGYLLPHIFAYLRGIDTKIFYSIGTDLVIVQSLGIIVALFPAASAMGATIPIFGRIAREYKIPLSILYGINTFGAASGVIFATFIGIGFFGLTNYGAMMANIGFLNCLISIFLGFILRNYKTNISFSVSDCSFYKENISSACLLATSITGFVTFALEVVWFRSLKSAFWSTTHTFAIILCAVLIAIALGSFVSTKITSKSPALFLFFGGIMIIATTPIIERVDLYVLSYSSSFSLYSRFLFSVLLVTPSFLAISIQVPYFLNQENSDVGWSKIYIANTFGTFLGALFGGWILLPMLGILKSSLFLGLVICMSSVFLLRFPFKVLGVIVPVALSYLVVMGGTGLGVKKAIGIEYYGGVKKLIKHFDGPDVTTSVVELEDNSYGLFIDGFMMSLDSRIAMYMKWMGYLPALYRESAPKNALVICFGTGQTLHAVKKAGALSIDMVDINNKVFEYANEFKINQGVILDPAVRKIVMDGSAWIRRTKQKYDLITLEPPPPNFAGVNSLYSLEFYQYAHDHLTTDGVISQWLPVHMMTSRDSRSVVGTFQKVFSNAILYLDAETGFGILVGSRNQNIALESKIFTNSILREDNTIPWNEVLGMRYFSAKDLAKYSAQHPIITDDNQLLSYGNYVSLGAFNSRDLEGAVLELENN